MRQIIQIYKSGELKVEDVPTPALTPGGVLVRNACSLISVGTERTKVEVARSNLLEMARKRPDQVKAVLDNVRQEGLLATYKKAMTKLDTPISLGYSSAGVVLEVGDEVQEFKIGDRVACAGEGYGCHAEIVFAPKNLCARVSDSVGLDQAAFAAVGAIALQAVRQAQVTVGERVAVIGLGLVGQLVVQVLKASGCQVLAIDLDPAMIELTRKLGADLAVHRSKDPVKSMAEEFSQGYGVDAVIITAATTSNDPVELAGALCREKGRVVVVGAVRMDIPRKDYYEKELSLCLSRAFGPGNYDKAFAEKGVDYPFGYVRWTAKRNMEAFLGLVAQGKIDPRKLVTHRFSIAEAPRAYELLRSSKERVLGALFEYEERPSYPTKIVLPQNIAASAKERVNLGFIGAGSFAQSYLLPNFRKADGVALKGVATATAISARNVAEKFGFEYCTGDYHEILDDPEIDCVIIATRHNLHAPLTIEALKRGKTVYVEKPLALNEEQLREVIEAHKQSRGRLMIGFNRRFSPFTQRAKSFFAHRAGPLVMTYRVNAGPLPPDHWVHDPEEGGGRIVGEVCHFVDLFQYLVDSPPVRVYAQTAGSRNENIPAEDNVNINIEFEDGSIGTIIYSSVGTLTFPRERFEIFGDNSVAVVDNFRYATFTRGGKTKKMKRWWGRDMGYRGEVAAFVDALKSGSEMPIPFTDIVLATLTTFRILDSIHEGKPVEISLPGLLA
jgi:predicted dehydrogenase